MKKQKTASEKYQMPLGKPTNKFVKKTPERRKQKREKTRSRNIDPIIVGAGFKPGHFHFFRLKDVTERSERNP